MSVGWGSSKWGSDPWGSGDAGATPIAPVITPLDPLNDASGVPQHRPITIRITDDVSVALSKTKITVNNLLLVLGGSPVNGATLVATPNSGHGYDLVVTPAVPFEFGSRQEVTVSAQDDDGQATVLVYAFTVGVGLRMLAINNPFENHLLVYFNLPMLADDAFLSANNWTITPISEGAAPLSVVEVKVQENQANVANLRYVGGGSTYLLGVQGVQSQSGLELEFGFSSLEFDLIFGDEPATSIRLFNSIFGPLGISQQVSTRRTMDKHVASRALALALDEQFRLRAQTLDGSSAFSGRAGKRRT